jgi:hypothetical protein
VPQTRPETHAAAGREARCLGAAKYTPADIKIAYVCVLSTPLSGVHQAGELHAHDAHPLQPGRRPQGALSLSLSRPVLAHPCEPHQLSPLFDRVLRAADNRAGRLEVREHENVSGRGHVTGLGAV